MKWIRCLVVTTVWLGWSSPAYAGMPFVTLSDLARMRFQVISFFVLALLLATWVIQRIWNGLRGDFPRLPRLSYKRALGLVTLWGLLFVLILTMISGARELMTPGAWKKQGFTYALADGPDKQDQSRAEQLDSQNNEARREALARLNQALWLYAQKHEGRFPLRDDVPEISEVLWRIPDYPSMRYIYIPGLKRDFGPYVLAYEPGILGPNRWVLLADGTVRQMTLPQIQQAIAPSQDTSDRPIKAEAREKRWIMSRGFKIFIFVFSTLLLLGCGGCIVPIDILAALVAGWGFYLVRVLPQIQLNWSGVATAIICLVGFAFGLHAFLDWFCRQWGSRSEIKPAGPNADFDSMLPPRWQRRWTASIVVLVLVSFATGMAATGIAHQVGWLITDTHPFMSSSGGARAAARRAQSTNNLKQIGLAAIEINERDKAFPPGCTVDSHGEVLHGWMTLLLPFLEQQKLFDEIDLKVPWDDPHNLAAFKQDVDVFQNPGFPTEQERDQDVLSLTNYAGNIHVLGGTRRLTTAEITDGTANTIMAGEIADRFPPWGKPGNWRDPAAGINRSPAGFGGPWRAQNAGAGANVFFLDGSVRFIKETVDPKVMEALGTPGGSEVISSDKY